MHYRTRQGDRLYQLCATHYGQQAGAVEAVLQANPGLASLGAVLHEGLLITLPALPTPLTRVTPVRLWQ